MLDDDEYDESKDEVVASLPIYLTQELTDKLYLLQYPLRPFNRPYRASHDVGSLARMRIKPLQKRIEMNYSIDTKRPNFDSHPDASEKYTTQTLTLNGRVVQPKTNYAIGTLTNGELHLSPLYAVCRVRPTLDYIDELKQKEKEEKEKAAKEAGEITDDSEAPPAPVKEEKKELKRVTVRVKRKESEKTAAHHKLTHAYLKQKEESEPWVDLKTFTETSNEAANLFGSLVAKNRVGVDFPMTPKQYLNYVVPPPPPKSRLGDRLNPFPYSSAAHMSSSSSSSSSSSMDLDGPSSSSFSSSSASSMSFDTFANKRLSINDFLICTLKNARLMSFSSICELADIRTKADVEEALACLEKCAHLVQGHWVLNSAYLYPTNRTYYARNYLISCFAKSRIVRRGEIQNILDLNIETSNDLFTELSVRLPNFKGFEFIMPTDDRFLEIFPEVAKRQNNAVEELGKKAMQVLTTNVSALPVSSLPSLSRPHASITSASVAQVSSVQTQRKIIKKS